MDANQHKPYRMPQSFDGIEEVTDSLERSSIPVVDYGIVGSDEIEEVDKNTAQQNNIINRKVKAGHVTEVTITSSQNPGQKTSVINGGTISSWENSEASHKVQMRLVITGTTFTLWVIWTIVGLVTYHQTGNAFLLITSPTTIAGMPLYRILYKIVKYYFS